MRTAIANQGEIRIDQIDALSNEKDLKPFAEQNENGFIISHSESGHHHLLSGDVDVMERTNAPDGARILQAIVKSPTRLWQDAATPHDTVELDPGIYEFRIKREYNPFLEQARRVMD